MSTPTDTSTLPSFEPQLLTNWKAGWHGAASGLVDPSDLAAELVTPEMQVWDGPWLACYMLRRFGWPNMGSDDYKNFMSWALTTPMEGVCLTVTPYMGCSRDKKRHVREAIDGFRAFHFGYLITDKVEESVNPQPQEHIEAGQRQRAFLQDWWLNTGRHQFGLLWCHPDEGETLVVQIGEPTDDEHVFGFYQRSEAMLTNVHDGETKDLMTPEEALKMLEEPMEEALAEELRWWIMWKKPEARAEVFTKLGMDLTQWPEADREKARAQRDENDRVLKEPVREALRTTLRDLLRPTRVRDVYFNAQGRVHDDQLEQFPHRSAPYFVGAGNTPEYWFTQGKQAAETETEAE